MEGSAQTRRRRQETSGRWSAPTRAVLIALALVVGACARSDEQWLDDLESPDPFVRALAAMAICEQAPEHAERAVPVLLETVDRSDVGLEVAAARELVRIAPQAGEVLVASLLSDEFMTTDRRSAALAALAASGEDGATAIAAALRGSGLERVGELAVVALVRIGTPGVPALVELLEEGERPELQRFAAFVLGELGPAARAAIPALQAARNHPDPAARAAIEKALERLAPSGAVQRGPEAISPRGR